MEVQKTEKTEKSEKETHNKINDFDNFEIDEDASRCSNGIITSNSDERLDIKIDLHDFDIEYKVFDHILVLFGKRKHHSNTSSPEKGRRYQAFVRPILLSPDMNSDKIVKEVENGVTHIKVPKNGTFKKLLDTKYCALCKFRECLCKHFPVLSEILE
ncbi:hypothetical protein RhiirA1_533226 [Rhizophagus irregularis]|uniref:SHSP domain-containing protein n=1 Tax=Rhizophagus irregularis TaxID=588596 RepID=A0A2N0S2H0_9GLOM|nr:hypothetical protein RhiirA1_533226 [Rhizophagus irregularis]CAB4468935.1 unnamed protein product [Rhizophagus irregularis]